jgi:hypothetical protein
MEETDTPAPGSAVPETDAEYGLPNRRRSFLRLHRTVERGCAFIPTHSDRPFCPHRRYRVACGLLINHMAGRPLLLLASEGLQNAIDLYFAECDDKVFHTPLPAR